MLPSITMWLGHTTRLMERKHSIKNLTDNSTAFGSQPLLENTTGSNNSGFGVDVLSQVHLSKQRLVARIVTQSGELDITSNKEAESHVSVSIGPL